MAPPRQISEEQVAFLMSRMPEYLMCSSHEPSNKAYQAFWSSVHGEFFLKYPERNALLAKGALPSPEEPPLPSEEHDRILGAAVKKRKEYIMNWYRNESAKRRTVRPVLKGVVAKKIQSLSKTHRLHQPEEMYEILYKEKITKATRIEPRTNADDIDPNTGVKYKDNSPRAKAMRIRRRVRHRLFEGELEEVLAEVTKALAEEQEEKERVQGDIDHTFESKTPEQIQEAIDQLKSLLTMVGKDIYDLTGWSMVCLTGGPSPIDNGNFAVMTASFGENEAGFSFEQSYQDWHKAVVPKFGDWLQSKYSPDVCASRAIQPRSDNEKTEDTAGSQRQRLYKIASEPEVADPYFNNPYNDSAFHVDLPLTLPSVPHQDDLHWQRRITGSTSSAIIGARRDDIPSSLATATEQGDSGSAAVTFQTYGVPPPKQVHPMALPISQQEVAPTTSPDCEADSIHIPVSRPSGNLPKPPPPPPKARPLPKRKTKAKRPAKSSNVAAVATGDVPSGSQMSVEVGVRTVTHNNRGELEATKKKQGETAKKKKGTNLQNMSGDHPISVFPAPPVGTSPLAPRSRKAPKLADGTSAPQAMTAAERAMLNGRGEKRPADAVASAQKRAKK